MRAATFAAILALAIAPALGYGIAWAGDYCRMHSMVPSAPTSFDLFKGQAVA